MNRESKGVTSLEEAKRLLKDVHISYQDALIKRGFRFLKAVALHNCDQSTQEVYKSGNIDRICEKKSRTFVKREADEQYSPAKYARYSVSNPESKNKSCDPCISHENQVSTMEFITGVNSMQYVIKYLTDDEISSAQVVPPQSLEMEDDNNSSECSTQDQHSKKANDLGKKETELLSYNYLHNDTILKEELIIEDELVPVTQDEYDRLNFNNFTSIDTDGVPDKNEDAHVDEIKTKIKSIDYHLHAPLYKGFTFKEAFSSLAEAIKKMRQKSDYWASFCTKQIENRIRHFQCNYKTKNINCPVQVLIVKRVTQEETTYLYYESSLHVHDNLLTLDNTTEITSEIKEETDAVIISDDESDRNSVIAEDIENHDDWTFERKFEDYKVAEEYVNNLNMLSFDLEVTTWGIKEFYKCKLVTDSANHCPASRYLLYENRNDDILMYTRNVRHADICPNRISPTNPIDSCPTETLTVIEIIESDEEVNETDDSNSNLSGPSISFDAMKYWILEKEFSSIRAAKKFLKEQNIWSHTYYYHTIKTGLNIYYRCTFPQCSAIKQIQMMHSSMLVSMYKSSVDHSHVPALTPDCSSDAFEALDYVTKNTLKAFIASGEAPQEIFKCIPFHVFNPLFQKEVLRSIWKFYREIGGLASIIIKSAHKWLQQILPIPSHLDSCFCVNLFKDDATETFRCFLSTRRLLLNAVNAKSIHVEAATAIYWRTNYITFIGTTNEHGKFHIFGLAITSSQQIPDYVFMFKAVRTGVIKCHNQLFSPAYLITDDNTNIHSAFLREFRKLHSIATCPKLALPKILKSLESSKCPDMIKSSIRDDIQKLFKLPSRPVFLKAVGLFLEKWRTYDAEHLHKFLNYFNTPWVVQISNWFEIFPQFTQDVHKGIKSEYNSLSQTVLRNGNFKIKEFLDFIKGDVEQISRACSNNNPDIVPTLTISESLYHEAIKWKKLIQQYKVVEGFPDRYYFSAVDEKFICEEKFKRYLECNHATLDELFDIQFSFWYLDPSKHWYSYCSCPYFLENFVCKHSVVEKFKNKFTES